MDEGLLSEDPNDSPRALEGCGGVEDGVLLGTVGEGLPTKAEAATATR